jgi:hypothetical protein
MTYTHRHFLKFYLRTAISVTKSRLLHFLFNFNLFIINLSYHSFLHSFPSSQYHSFLHSFPSASISLIRFHFHSRLISYSFSIESSKSFTMNPKSAFVLQIRRNIERNPKLFVLQMLAHWTSSSSSSNSRALFNFKLRSHIRWTSSSSNSQAPFNFKLQVQHSHSLNLYFLRWLVFELIWFWIKIWMRSYFVVWAN